MDCPECGIPFVFGLKAHGCVPVCFKREREHVIAPLPDTSKEGAGMNGKSVADCAPDGHPFLVLVVIHDAPTSKGKETLTAAVDIAPVAVLITRGRVDRPAGTTSGTSHKIHLEETEVTLAHKAVLKYIMGAGNNG
jgi:hypothetical protein